MTVKVHIDSKSYKIKPKDDVRNIKPRLQNSTPVNLTISELADKLSKGYSVSPAVLKGGCRAENWQEQQVFMVDIDNDKKGAVLMPKQAKDICNQNNIPVSFMYHSFSSTREKPKYRLVFICAEIITDRALREVIAETLVSLFPQADESCKNADRLFFGTNIQIKNIAENATFSIENILIHHTPKVKSFGASNDELENLKRDFDLFSYMKSLTGDDLKFNNSKCAMFKHCCICGHSNDLVYYHDTNTFKCFGAHGNVGGSVIDFIMYSQNKDLKNAIEYFKHKLLKMPKEVPNKLQRRDYAISKGKISISNPKYQKYLKQLRPEDNPRYTLDDKGMGELFADIHKDKLRYNVTAKEWFYFNGKVWEEDTGSMRASRYAKVLADELIIYSTEIDNDSKKFSYQDFYIRLGIKSRRDTMLADTRDKYFISNESLDKNLY